MTISENEFLIGCDETGVGDYFTPVIFTCVFLNKKQRKTLKNIGINDSKKLSSRQIKNLASVIEKNSFYKTVALNQNNYNKMIEAKINANEIKMISYLELIEKFFNSFYEDIKDINFKIIIDQFSTTNSIEQYIKKIIHNKIVKLKHFNQFNLLFFEMKAESKYLEVASASILARNALINLMNKQNSKWNENFPLGAWNPIIENFGKKFIEKNGWNNFSKIAKIHFKNTEKLKKWKENDV
ncbi:ribonuclease HIII [[Mycoplasma] collis]|uniref:ribonuclease HIII n=1 Tax=[Mycoplasma] collis TaxID=2127 RepID=UPI00051AE794|nr:ribonuclease HIII [[Mycoplasma] collis]